MILRIVHCRDDMYDVYDRTSGKWLFSRTSADNVFSQLAKYGLVQIEFTDEIPED